MKTIKELLLDGIKILRCSSDTEPERTVRLILSHLSGKTTESLITETNQTLEDDLINDFLKMVSRRADGKPLQYILGEWDFYGRSFYLTPDVFIPRPETEFIIDAVKKIFPAERRLKILDIGTGSGAIAITLALEFPNSEVIATDISTCALSIARKSANRLKAENRVLFIVSDGLDALKKKEEFDLITSNPPYVPDHEYAGLQKEIREWEPKIALNGGVDGLDFIRKLLLGSESSSCISEFMKDGAIFAFEIGYRQFDGVIGIIKKSKKFTLLDVIEDYNGIPRTVIAGKN